MKSTNRILSVGAIAIVTAITTTVYTWPILMTKLQAYAIAEILSQLFR